MQANQPRASWEARKKQWATNNGGVAPTWLVDGAGTDETLSVQREWLDPADKAMTVTLHAMEVKTLLVTLA
jgi:hypothetical protein